MKKSGARCIYCGRLLRSEKSIAIGAGRDCIRKYRFKGGLAASQNGDHDIAMGEAALKIAAAFGSDPVNILNDMRQLVNPTPVADALRAAEALQALCDQLDQAVDDS